MKIRISIIFFSLIFFSSVICMDDDAMEKSERSQAYEEYEVMQDRFDTLNTIGLGLGASNCIIQFCSASASPLCLFMNGFMGINLISFLEKNVELTLFEDWFRKYEYLNPDPVIINKARKDLWTCLSLNVLGIAISLSGWQLGNCW